MPGTDNIVINVRERPLSTDINDLESLVGRTIMDQQLYGQRSKQVGSIVEGTVNTVLGGLQVQPSGNDISVAVGALLQNSATLAPVPGPLDSTYRVGVLRAPVVITMPAPGVTTFYLLESQVAEITAATVSRDVLDPGTGIFVPTMVPKQKTFSVQFQLVTGGADAPAPSGGDWVPHAIVRRPGGGGPVVASDIIDLRRIADFGNQKPQLPSTQLGVLTANGSTSSLEISVQAEGGLGPRAYRSSTTKDVSAADVLSPGLVLAANTNYYLYLAPWSLFNISPRYTDGSNWYEGVLVLSSVAPDAQTFRNTGAIALPAPFGVVTAAAGSAYLVSALRRNAGNTGWIFQWSAAQGREMNHESILAATYSPPADPQDVNFATFVPAHARSVKIVIVVENTPTDTPVSRAMQIETAGGFILRTFSIDMAGFNSFETEIPMNGALGTTLRFNLIGGGYPVGSSATFSVVGYGW